MASSLIAILLKDKRGEGRIEGEEEVPWNCPVDKGELIIEIPEKERVPNTDGKQPHNYRLYTGEHDNITLYAGPTDISPLHGTEVDYLLPVHPPSARIQQYTRESRMTEIMNIKVGDSVIFKLDQGKSNPIAYVRGKVRHLGTIPENEGIYFGIEITEDQYLGKGTTNGRPHFNCGPNNAVYIAMDKIVQKSTYHSDKDDPSKQQGVPPKKPVISTQPTFSEKPGQRHFSSPAHNTRSRSEAFLQEKKDTNSGSYSRESPGMEPKRDSLWSKGKGVVDKIAQTFTGPLSVTAMVESEVVPHPDGYQFKEGDRVVLQSAKDKTINGTVRWVGQVKSSKEAGSIPIKAVGIETDVKIKPDKEFPDLHLCVTGSHGHELFRVAHNHGRIYLPEQLVVHAKDYTQQQQIDNQQEVKIAKDYGLSVEEYRAQQEMLEEANKNRDMDHEGRRQEYTPPDPPIGDEEVLAAGKGELDHSIYMLGTGQPFTEERIERERQALKEFKGQQGGQHRQHHHEEITHDYQVIEEGRLEEKEVEGSFIEISQFTSSQLSGNGASADRKQTSQEPSTNPPLYQNLVPSQTSGKTNFSKSTPPNLNNPPGRAERCPSPSERLPNLSLPSQPTPSSGPPTQDPSQFAIGSMVYLPTQRGEGLQGVVMWIGTLPEIDGLVAGVELDNPLSGCTDGTRNGRRFFNCLPGRAYFCPIEALRLDTRYIDPGQIPAAAREDLQNPLKDLVPQFEEEDTFVTPDLFTKYIGDEHGIQGHHNSCYLDATVFGFFALSDSFDMMLLEEPNDHVGQKIKYILWKGIVNPLRKYGLARHESVMELRNNLEEFGRMKGANKDEKDPEEFLNLLFKEILHVKPFLSIKRPFGVEKEYFIQLFFEIDPQQNELPETEKLIAQMFHEQKISFTNVPSKLLLQMPRFGKDFKMYNRIIPSLTINVKPLLDPSARGTQKCHFCLSKTATTICYTCPKDLYHINEPYVFYCSNCCEKAHKNRKDHHCEDVVLQQGNIGDVNQISQMQLLSVICIETSHYVCYTRSQNRWLFHDSMANRLYDMYNIPRVVDVTQDLQDWVYNPENRQKLKDSPAKSIPEYVRRFTQDIYMCVYVNPDLDLYGEATDPIVSLQGGEHSHYGGQQSGHFKSTTV